MNNITITDRVDWKLKVSINPCDKPEDCFHICFSGEQYNKEGEMTEKSSYDFFLNETELVSLSNFLLKRS
jgi:hypothetical protein